MGDYNKRLADALLAEGWDCRLSNRVLEGLELRARGENEGFDYHGLL